MKLVRVEKISELKNFEAELGDYTRAYKVFGGVLVFYTIEEVRAWENDDEYSYEIVGDSPAIPEYFRFPN